MEQLKKIEKRMNSFDNDTRGDIQSSEDEIECFRFLILLFNTQADQIKKVATAMSMIEQEQLTEDDYLSKISK